MSLLIIGQFCVQNVNAGMWDPNISRNLTEDRVERPKAVSTRSVNGSYPTSRNVEQ